MKAIVGVLLLLLSCFTVHAKEDYLLYHRRIIKCEEDFLIYHDIPAALVSYKKVLNEYHKPFAKDCFIALQLACSINDSASTVFFFQKAFERGVEWIAIEEAKPVAQLLHYNPNYNQRIEALYQQVHPKYLQSINLSLRSAVIAMKTRDDSFKMRLQGLPSGPEREQKDTDFRAELDSNTLKIVRLTKQYGFLGDNMVGYMNYGFQNDKAQERLHCYQLRSLIDQLYYHHGCCYFMLRAEMKKALQSGDISPAMYAVIYEWAYKDLQEKDLKDKLPRLSLCKAAGKQEKYYNICPIISPWDKNTDLAMVDICREEIGLPTLEHFKKKKEFEKETGMRMFFGMFNTY